MLLARVTSTPLTLRGVTDPNIAALANLKPDFTAGDQVHAHYVNHVAGALPGNQSQLFGTGPSFRSIFYPHYSAQAPEGSIESDTGLDGNWWSAFSVAVLCQIIAKTSSHLRSQMLSSKIDNDVSNYNNQLITASSAFYSRVLATFPPIATLVAQLNRATAKSAYRQALVDNIPIRQLWYQAGVWNSPDWEMFNHYAKYMILGASAAEVDALIDTLVAGGLPIPTSVDKNHWRSYARFLVNHPVVDYTSLSAAASDAVHATTYLPTMSEFPASMPEGNSYEFTANSQPGNKYREPPSHSCFAADTNVLMDSGEPKAIVDIRPGERVASPDGPRTVLYVSAPARGGRPLYRLGGNLGPMFTGTHPLVNADDATDAPAALSVDAARLRALVPSLNQRGVGALVAGRKVWVRDGNTQERTVVITGIDEAAAPGDIVYDLILAYSEPGAQTYWAGQNGSYVLTQPEMPRAIDSPEAAVAVTVLLEGLSRHGVPGVDENADASVLLEFRRWLHHNGAAVFQAALLPALEQLDGQASSQETPRGDVGAQIDRLLTDVARRSSPEATVIGTVLERLLDDVGAAIEASIQLGFRSMAARGGDVFSVSVFDLTLDVDREPTTPPMTRLVMIAETDQGAGELPLTIHEREEGSSPFRRCYNRIVYLALPRDQASKVVRFELRVAGLVPPLGIGVLAPLAPNEDYQRRTVTLIDALGKQIGYAHLDLRRMTQSSVQAELSRSAQWSPTDEGNFARALGQAMVTPLIAALGQRRERATA